MMVETTTEEPTTQALPIREPIAPFEDWGISMAAQGFFWNPETYESRDDSPFTKEELAKLAQQTTLRLGYDTKSLADLPKYFPNLRSLDILGRYYSEVTEEQLTLIAGLGLKALTLRMNAPVDPKPFANLPYLNITSNAFDDADERIPADTGLAKHSVLGEQFIKNKIDGVLIEYLRVNYGGRLYELFVKAPSMAISEHNGEEYLPIDQAEAWLFICKKAGQSYSCIDSYGPLPRYAYYNGIHGGLALADANFDGREDILILYAVEGVESRPYYHALLQQPNGKYKLCESFREIPHPELCARDNTVMGSARGGMGARYYELYAYQNESFVNIESLYRHWVFAGENEDGSSEGFDAYDVTASDDTKKTTYSPETHSEAYLKKVFLDDNSKWGLNSDKWLHLSEIENEMIMKIISDK